MLRWTCGIVGFFVGFIGCALLFAYLATQHNIDVFHMYLAQPVPPPGGYRTPLDVPPATWPMLVILAVAAISAKLAVLLANKLGASKSTRAAA